MAGTEQEIVISIPDLETPDAEAPPEAAPTSIPGEKTETKLSGRDEVELQLTILGNSSSSKESRREAERILLTALGGGYSPDLRLRIARSLLAEIDQAYHSLLARHLVDIRIEAEALGREDMVREAKMLLERLEAAED